MAIGDKLYLADKVTLDKVNTNVADIHSRVGATTDTGGSATAGTLMGKLNALISSILAHVSNWTAARAANLDAAISTRESEANALSRYNTLNGNTAVNNIASASGTLSQKLSHIINLLAGNGVKQKSTKLSITMAGGNASTTVFNVTGAGEIIAIYTGGENSNVSATIVLDGVTYTQAMGGYLNYGVGFDYINGKLLTGYNNANVYQLIQPVCFSESCKITLALGSGNSIPVRIIYNMYE